LYVAAPGIRDYLEYGGHGILVFDIDDEHRFLRRIATGGVDRTTGKPLNVKGVCANAKTKRIYISTTQTLQSIDLATERLIWEREYVGGCDRMALTPDGATIFLPSFEGPYWHVVDAATGDVISKIEPNSGAHNTICGPSGRWAYLAGLKSPLLTMASASTREIARTVGPFGAPVRPFTINGSETRVYVNVNELLGFEIGDIESGKVLARVEVPGFSKGPIKRHGCPSHGIGLTPDERELWVCDAANQRMHVFDATRMPPVYLANVKLRDEPGWIHFGIGGRYAYPSTGDVVEIASRRIVARLTDEMGRGVQSEKQIEIDFEDGRPVMVGDQFGVGGVRPEKADD
jgi:DNA-binding beta-propeller fold protein YncE